MSRPRPVPTLSPLILLWVLGLALMACESPVEWQGDTRPPKAPSDSLITYYRTRHFVFFYDSSAFNKAEVIANGKEKEAHLSRINSELNVAFDGEIMVRLIHSTDEPWSGEAFFEKPYFIQETRSYFVIDPGHEVAHIISFETMGVPKLRFFLEGLAVAHELDPNPKWARLCRYDITEESVAEDLQHTGQILSSYDVNYPLAGAYVEWLEQTFGIERFKDFYWDLAQFSYSTYESICLRDFGVEASELHQRFIDERLKPARGSKYCGYNSTP
ncbi:MAG: hypothetical protein JWO30_3657 [Fibrobacteres bacterium]|nr:hypothetical protein [Fibrobacterota bacterium]